MSVNFTRFAVKFENLLVTLEKLKIDQEKFNCATSKGKQNG